MKVSLNIVKQYVTVDVGVDELVAKINQQLGGVEAGLQIGAALAPGQFHPFHNRRLRLTRV